ncbi:uroporphyrinogen decarboxylase [Halosquirtibacter laminarini]|uniref:Uroporphyrinogen decarboxylase n=1 Tax=Halosquirtibacter laminarini TaxID=3374600 RepID=A0AC61NEA9_9BACT|nr:uroporphyrinogen decarboxylase [Prolixibacteraceae bacterium]
MPQSLFLDTLQGKTTHRPPVWFMRQAGRVLPSYMRMREEYGFKEMMDNPELAAKVTLLPISDLGVDAAILFSDILVIPEALGMELSFEGKGPSFKTALKDVQDINNFLVESPEKLHHIYKAIDLIKEQKPNNIPLIGFCGGPLTTLCYMYQGFSQNLNFPDVLPALYRDKKNVMKVIDRITEISIEYAKNQVAHGIDAFQLFETHAGLVPTEMYKEMFLPSVKKILQTVRSLGTKTIFLPKGIGTGIDMVNYDLCDCISIDWQTSISEVRKYVGDEITLQGNFDPRILQTTPEVIDQHFKTYLDFGKKEKNWIFNLGHGLLPSIPESNVKHLVNLVKNSDWNR